MDLDLTEFNQADRPLVEIKKGIKKAHLKAVKLMAAEFSKALDDAMDSNVWDWKGETRNIVDTGELKKAKKLLLIPMVIFMSFMALIMLLSSIMAGIFTPMAMKTLKRFTLAGLGLNH